MATGRGNHHLHEPLLPHNEDDSEAEAARSRARSSLGSTNSDAKSSQRELTEIGDEAQAREDEVNSRELLVSGDHRAEGAVEYRGVTPPKEVEEEEEPYAGRHVERTKRPWKTTNQGRSWFSRRRGESSVDGDRHRRQSSTWNDHGGAPKPRGHQPRRTVVRLAQTPTSPGSTPSTASGRELGTGFEPAQVNDLQLQYDKEGFRITSRAPSTDSMDGVIDGRFSSSFTEPLEAGYIAVEATGADMSTTKALDMCTRYVLNPFHIFLKVIGWRPFRSLQRDTQPCYKKTCNIIYPAFIFLMLVFTGFTQTITCFSRTRAHSPNLSGEYFVLDCRQSVVSSLLTTDILLLIVYVWALYNFRLGEPEHLSTLIQKVFLSCNSDLITLRRSQKRLVFVLLSFLMMGVVWLIFSFGTSVLRLYALRLNNNNTIISWFSNDSNATDLIVPEDVYNILHYVFVVCAMLGFCFFDLLYIAVVINYCTQCQLLHYYVSSIKDKVINKVYLLGDAVKEIYNVREFLRALNGTTSYVTSLTLFIFLQGVALSFIDWKEIEPYNYIQIAVGFLNVFQWTLVLVLPVIQATRLTAECKDLKKLGLEIAARPFYYSDTPQLILDSFLNYTNSTNYRVKLMFIPMYSEVVVGFVFFFFLVFSLWLTQAQFKFADWI